MLKKYLLFTKLGLVKQIEQAKLDSCPAFDRRDGSCGHRNKGNFLAGVDSRGIKKIPMFLYVSGLPFLLSLWVLRHPETQCLQKAGI